MAARVTSAQTGAAKALPRKARRAAATGAFNPNGVILWEGASALDGAPIVVIATGIARKSGNVKTGWQIQTFILLQNEHPTSAVKSGGDASICGDCIHRPVIAAALKKAGKPSSRCYVRVGQSVAAVYRCYKAGRYKRISPLEASILFTGRDVRLGTYGDPGAAPSALWDSVLTGAASNTAYSHQWRTAPLSSVAMASVDSEAETLEAWAQGWRTFRVAPVGAPRLPGEVQCPASREMGAKTTCAKCRACGGNGAKAKASILIWDHGPSARGKRRFALSVNGRAA